MKVAVLGAGILGTASAWFLNQRGCEVTVIERQQGAARETSFANGCQISVSHAEPWANPNAPLKILKWLGHEDAPLLFRLRPDLRQWLWGMQFLRECSPQRTRRNIIQILAIAAYSRSTLQSLRRELNIEYDHLERGILHFYTDQKEFDGALGPTELMKRYGCEREIKTADEMVALEPALATVRHKIVGGTYTPSDESGDIQRFTSQLADRAADKGVQFKYGHTITRLLRDGQRIKGVEVIQPDGSYSLIEADAYVMAMGSFSPELLKPIGLSAMIYPAKGYSATYNVVNPSATPTISLTDDGYKLVFSRLGNRLRVAGTAELNGYQRDLNPTRCAALTRRTRELFPDACDYDNPLYWSGLRPATPSNVPLIGQSKLSNLYLNTGHGTLGWTMGVGSGKALADIVTGRQPEVQFAFMGKPEPTEEAMLRPVLA